MYLIALVFIFIFFNLRRDEIKLVILKIHKKNTKFRTECKLISCPSRSSEGFVKARDEVKKTGKILFQKMIRPSCDDNLYFEIRSSVANPTFRRGEHSA
jgi:hypothetical protein